MVKKSQIILKILFMYCMRIYFVVFMVFLSLLGFSQDPHYSQPSNYGVNLNPAFMGINGNNTAFFNYRNQWPAISNAYITNFFGYNHYIQKYKMYVGVNHLYNTEGNGTLKTHYFSLNAAKDFMLWDKLLIRPGLKFGLMNKSIDFSKLTLGSMINPGMGGFTNGTGGGSVTNFNAAIGSYFNFKNLEFGFAFHNLIPSNESFTGGSSVIPVRSALQVAYNIAFTLGNYDCVVSPYAFYQKQGDFQMRLTGIQAQIKYLIFGTSVRVDDAVIGMIGINTKYFKVLYSYDYTVSKLSNASASSHEFGIFIRPPFKPKETTAHKFTSSFM
jgi:type IX secretion system PorP/SprF family membrane protein